MYNFAMLPESPLMTIESRLRYLLPAEMYVAMWGNPSLEVMVEVHKHLRTLQRILHDYTARQVDMARLKPGDVRTEWQQGTMMFTDLAGFTKLMEANSLYGREGAENLVKQLTKYFSAMIEIISKSSGDLVEFTGDAMLVIFPRTEKNDDAVRAVRAGLRMQRAMKEIAAIETAAGSVNLKMRIGIHSGRFLTADIGTPRRMEHVLLGRDVHQAKLIESLGRNERVNLSEQAYEWVKHLFRVENGEPGCHLVIDDLSDAELGEYEILPARRRAASKVLLEMDKSAVLEQIVSLLDSIEPMASFIPGPVLTLLIESAADRAIRPDFPRPTILFVNIVGLAECADRALPGEERKLALSFSRVFSLINAAVEARGGVLKKVTYHLSGSDMVIYFGAPTAHTNDEMRAASAAVAIREIVRSISPPVIGEIQPEVYCQIGIHSGPAFVGEIGEPRGRREYNLLGDTVNTTARLMNLAMKNQIVLSECVQKVIEANYECLSMGEIPLKGKERPMPLFELIQQKTGETFKGRPVSSIA